MIEVGETYLNKSQEKVEILFHIHPKMNPDEDYPFLGYNHNTRSWDSYTARGHYNQWEQDSNDLIVDNDD